MPAGMLLTSAARPVCRDNALTMVAVCRAMRAMTALGNAEDAPESSLFCTATLAALLHDIHVPGPSAAKLLGGVGALIPHISAAVTALVCALTGGVGCRPFFPMDLCSDCALCFYKLHMTSVPCRNALAPICRSSLLAALLKHCPSCTSQHSWSLGRLRGSVPVSTRIR